MWKHPKYYKELRSIRNKLDQVISSKNRDGECERAAWSGPKPQAASAKLQAPSLESSKQQAPSGKPEVPSSKPEATSSLILEPGNKK